MRKILAPHKEQDGWVYERIPRISLVDVESPFIQNGDGSLTYTDDTPGSRIISSLRVEEAVETSDFLKLCAEEGLTVCFDDKRYGPWLVGGEDATWHYSESRGWGGEDAALGTTLRQAYYRYHASKRG